MTHRRIVRGVTGLLMAVGVGWVIHRIEIPIVTSRVAAQGSPQSAPGATVGQSSTRLSDGRWLVLGGQGADGPVATASIFDPTTHTSVVLPEMNQPRAWHTATLLSDGTVLVLGGRNGEMLVEVPEIFNPATGTFASTPIVGAAPRASHTATLLTDGHVLVVGGRNGGASPLPTEVWDPNAQTATTVGADALGRTGHTATLMGDGRVLVSGGATLDGRPATDAMAINPANGTRQSVPPQASDRTVPTVTAFIPVSDATDVPVDAHLAVRFSEPLNVDTLTSDTVSVSGPDGLVVATRVIVAEEGRLAFVWPAEHFGDGTSYTLAVSGALGVSGVAVAPASVTFTTVQPTPDSADHEAWVPDGDSLRNGWRTNRPPSPWESLTPLTAPPGVTAIAGRALTLDGRPLPSVTLGMNGATTETDRTGRFLLLLKAAASGRHVLTIDGHTAGNAGRRYGFFEYGMTVAPGHTNTLAFTIWMPKLDMRHVVTLPSPTTREVVITTPSIPGLELHIPPQTVLRGQDGKAVVQVGITAIPVDRPPFPLAKNVDVPVYFTIQPGSSYVYTAGSGPKGAWLVYPNYRQGVPGQRIQFFHYDPDQLDWYVYGLGTVAPNAAQVAPDPTTRLYEFTGAMINGDDSPPPTGPQPATTPKADPVDPATGVFSMQKTDLFLPDVIPLALTRTYNSGDNLDRSFGIGMTNPYAMFLWSANQYQEADLILPNGGRIHYVRTSPGTLYSTAVFEHTTTPTAFYKSTIAWNGNGWDLTLTDGTVYVMGEMAPIQAIRDRYGNTVTITHATGQTGNVTSVTSPSGRSLAFTYDTHTPKNHVTQVTDNAGRTVSYTYTTAGCLATVTDPNNQVTTYTYDTSNRLLTITDGRAITYLTNTYTNGRVATQTLADTSAAYAFAYTVDGSGNITQTNVTDPRGHVEQLVFNGDHYVTSDTQAYGTSLARTTTTTRQSGSNLVTAVVDGLSRETDSTYDSTGHVLTTTRLAGTGNAVTTTFTYEPLFFQLATLTDPLSHTWTNTYDATGHLTGATDPLSDQRTFVLNTAGQLTQITDPLSHTWQLGYLGGDLISMTDPLNAVQTQFVDAAGRIVSRTDPLGRTTSTTFDALNRPTAVVDPLGGQTLLTYDANSNLLSLTDGLTHATSYTYDTSNRAAIRTDPLTHAASYQYDLNSNLTQVTDRKSQATGSQYDALDRLTQMTFADTSTITYTYDTGDRITQIVDSTNGTTTRTYDGLDRLTEETTSQGTVDYTYDADGRRATMTVAGQTAVSYSYDNANRLASITQGASDVSMTYDDANRRNTLTYPNGIVATSGYDAANHLTSLTYSLGGTTVGDLMYTYDASGNRTSVGGSWARTGIPAPLTSATYDAANRVTAWGSTSPTYDLNGNLTGDGSNSYTWNARDQLSAISGGVSASFQYDGTGRRRGKTISGTTTNFLYDGLNFVQELSGGGTPTANLLTGLRIDETFTRTDAGGTRSLLVDALGSTLELADTSGTPQTHYTLDPFGTTTVSGTTSTNAAQYTGRENDGTDLYYYRARYYSSLNGRFVAEDPLSRLPQPQLGGFAHAPMESDGPDLSSNWYLYAQDRPTNLIDPTGLFPYRFPFFAPGCSPAPESCKQYPVGGVLYRLCMITPDGPRSNCIRGCLAEAYRICSSFGCGLRSHIRCFWDCGFGAETPIFDPVFIP